MDGNVITAKRTAAVSAIATKVRPEEREGTQNLSWSAFAHSCPFAHTKVSTVIHKILTMGHIIPNTSYAQFLIFLSHKNRVEKDRERHQMSTSGLQTHTHVCMDSCTNAQ